MFDYIEKLAQGTKASMYLRLRSHFVKPTKSLKGAGGLERPVEAEEVKINGLSDRNGGTERHCSNFG